MKPVLKILFLIAVVFASTTCYSQDINFSQFSEIPLLRNPALAGIFSGDLRIASAFRNQWQSVTIPYRTVGFGGEMKFPLGQYNDDFITIGLQTSYDVAGDSKLSKLQLLPVVNYHKAINENSYLSAGIMAGPVQQRFDPSKLQFDDQFVNGAYSPANPTRQVFNNSSTIYMDAAAGVCFSSSFSNDIRYYFAAGVFHFTHPKVAFLSANDISLNQKWVLNAGFSIPTSDVNKITLYADFFTQGGNRQAQGGFLLIHDLIQYDEDQKIAFEAGSFYRWNDAIIPVVKLDYYKLSVGISYDVNINKLTVASAMKGGLEVTLSYADFLKSKNSSLYKQRCPAF